MRYTYLMAVSMASARSLGWSSLDHEGMPLYDLEADGALVQELKIHLESKIFIIVLNLHLNTREFAEVAVKQFISPLPK